MLNVLQQIGIHQPKEETPELSVLQQISKPPQNIYSLFNTKNVSSTDVVNSPIEAPTALTEAFEQATVTSVAAQMVAPVEAAKPVPSVLDQLFNKGKANPVQPMAQPSVQPIEQEEVKQTVEQASAPSIVNLFGGQLQVNS